MALAAGGTLGARFMSRRCLLSSVTSYAIPEEQVSGTLFGSGLLTAGFCMVYWLANPNLPS